MCEDAERTPLDHTPSATCSGEKCRMCGAAATHKVGEEIPFDRPEWNARHNFTAYVCCTCFGTIFGRMAALWCAVGRSALIE